MVSNKENPVEQINWIFVYHYLRKNFYEEKIMLNKLSKLPFNRSFIVRAPHATKL